MPDTMTIAAVADCLRSRLDCRGNLLAVMPWSRVALANFCERHADELAAMLGRSLRVQRSGYTPTGRGAFGRLGGGGTGGRSKLGLFWCN